MKRILIVTMLVLIWAIPVMYAQVKWEEEQSGKMVKVVIRRGYHMKLYKDKAFFVLTYNTPSGKKIGVSYWRQDHKPLIGDTLAHHYISEELLKLDPSLGEICK